jgi:hypothetical protein
MAFFVVATLLAAFGAAAVIEVTLIVFRGWL